MADLVLALEHHGPPFAATVRTGLWEVVVDAVVIGSRIDGGNAVGVVGDVVSGTIELRITTEGDGFVATEHEFLVVSRHHEGLEVDGGAEGGVHLFVEPVAEAIDVAAACGDGSGDFERDFVVEGLGAAEGALAEESPDFAFERLTCRSLP